MGCLFPSDYKVIDTARNQHLMHEITVKDDAWKMNPTYQNLKALWLVPGGPLEMFVIRRIHLPGLKSSFDYMFPAHDFDNRHLSNILSSEQEGRPRGSRTLRKLSHGSRFAHLL